jgi:hypothetical protein
MVFLFLWFLFGLVGFIDFYGFIILRIFIVLGGFYIFYGFIILRIFIWFLSILYFVLFKQWQQVPS